MKYTFVLIFFLLFCYLYIHFFINSSIKYITPKEGYYIIDKSNYFKTFNENDFKIRNCDNEEHCKQIYKKNLTNFSSAEKKHLGKLVNKTNNFLKKYPSLNNIPWLFCKINPNIEEGFPHTHSDVIFLSKYFFKNRMKNKIETLIHEKIHVYQRKYPRKTQIFYKKKNFNKNNINTHLRRANPDVDKFNYDFKGTEFYLKYDHDPVKINDVVDYHSKENDELIEKYGFKNEHPNEIFAYLISKKIVNNNLKDKDMIDYIS